MKKLKQKLDQGQITQQQWEQLEIEYRIRLKYRGKMLNDQDEEEELRDDNSRKSSRVPKTADSGKPEYESETESNLPR